MLLVDITTPIQFWCFFHTLTCCDIHLSLRGLEPDCTWLAWHQNVRPVSSEETWTSPSFALSRQDPFHFAILRDTPLFSAFCGGANQFEVFWICFPATELSHGLQLTFCRGVPSRSTTPVQQKIWIFGFWWHHPLDKTTDCGTTGNIIFWSSDSSCFFIHCDTPTFSAFCGGAPTTAGFWIISPWTELLHGIQLTFCRGVPASSTTPTTLLLIWNIADWRNSFLTTATTNGTTSRLGFWLINCGFFQYSCATPTFSAFCGGAPDTDNFWINHSWTELLHGSQLTFCRGVFCSSITSLHQEQTLGYWWHSIPARAEPCGASAFSAFICAIFCTSDPADQGTHGLCTVICCEASDTPQLDFAQLRHWPHWCPVISYTPLFLAFCGGALAALHRVLQSVSTVPCSATHSLLGGTDTSAQLSV